MTDERHGGGRPSAQAAAAGGPQPQGEFRKQEYDALYREIADNSSRLYTILSVCVTATTAFLGYFLKQVADKQVPEGQAIARAVKDFADPLPFILLVVVFLVIFPCMLLVESCGHSTVRIAGYLAVFYEEPGDSQWQSRLQSFRLLKDKQPKGSNRGGGGRRFGIGLRSIFDGLSFAVLICACWSAWQVWPHQWGWTTWWVFFGICAAFLILHYRLRRRLKRSWSNEKFAELQEDWRLLASQQPQAPHTFGPRGRLDSQA